MRPATKRRTNSVSYLQPLLGRASIDVLISVMLPIGAFVVSLGAFALSMIK